MKGWNDFLSAYGKLCREEIERLREVRIGRRCPHCGSRSAIEDNGCRGADLLWRCGNRLPWEATSYGEDVERVQFRGEDGLYDCGMEWGRDWADEVFGGRWPEVSDEQE